MFEVRAVICMRLWKQYVPGKLECCNYCSTNQLGSVFLKVIGTPEVFFIDIK